MMSRDQLLERLSVIKEAPMRWLQEIENHELAEWLTAITSQPLPKKQVPEALRKPQKES